jgi:hypothetical protein
MKIKYKKSVLTVLIFICWYFYPFEYYRIMGTALDSKKEHPEITMFDGEVEPSMPNYFLNNMSVLGIDSNNNGIRDDIDIWINRTAFDYNERMAMRQFAKASQEKLKVCNLKLNDKVDSMIVQNTDGYFCLAATSDYFRQENFAVDNIEDLTFSTLLRRHCLKYYAYVPASYSRESTLDYHQSCKFEIQGKEELINKYKAKQKRN